MPSQMRGLPAGRGEQEGIELDDVRAQLPQQTEIEPAAAEMADRDAVAARLVVVDRLDQVVQLAQRTYLAVEINAFLVVGRQREYRLRRHRVAAAQVWPSSVRVPAMSRPLPSFLPW